MAQLGEKYRELDPKQLQEVLAAEAAALDFDAFDLDSAWEIGTWIRERALADGLGIGFSIVFGEQRVFHAATPGAAAVNDAWLERKFRVVRHYAQASLAVRVDYLADGGSFETDSNLDLLQYAAAGGAVPIRVRGQVIGAVGVSGLEMHDDHALVVQALEAQLAKQQG